MILKNTMSITYTPSPESIEIACDKLQDEIESCDSGEQHEEALLTEAKEFLWSLHPTQQRERGKERAAHERELMARGYNKAIEELEDEAALLESLTHHLYFWQRRSWRRTRAKMRDNAETLKIARDIENIQDGTETT
jgi:hypothetical protein